MYTLIIECKPQEGSGGEGKIHIYGESGHVYIRASCQNSGITNQILMWYRSCDFTPIDCSLVRAQHGHMTRKALITFLVHTKMWPVSPHIFSLPSLYLWLMLCMVCETKIIIIVYTVLQKYTCHQIYIQWKLD